MLQIHHASHEAQAISLAATLATSQDARLLARETLRISASLASSPAPSAVASSPEARNLGIVDEQFVDASLRLICCEEINGRRWNYVVDNEGGQWSGQKRLSARRLLADSSGSG
ncbi:Protein root UVB sensitive 6 [Vitis vinifera]|uniref:Protein root UVB sensitive 6 n=1 Tax=Vitis vinifera TaxID=29760 RepID=A0A438E9S4_VITVI|nr:Protein root UVB sensitive 6 [Vitis vinifera]